MMVVIGIIGVLAAALTGGYSYMVKSAQRAKATEAVSNARSALEALYIRKDNTWPPAILDARTYNGYHVMDENVAKVLFQNSLLNVDCKKVADTGALESDYTLRGADRCGIADPWAMDVIKKADKNLPGSALISRAVSSGGRVQDHLIYFAVDQDDDGFVDKSEGAPVNKVRAKVLTWCAGADGGLGDCTTDKRRAEKLNGRTVSNGDNVYSWKRTQEER
jgi:type II secretory pathway pseudopilin PulG